MPGQVNTYRTTFTMTQELLERLQSPSGGGLPYQSNNNPSPKIELILDDVEQKIPSHIGFLQRRRNLEIFVNGVRQNAPQPLLGRINTMLAWISRRIC